MSTAQDYRNKADEYAGIAGSTRSLRDGSDCRKIAQAYRALAEAEHWLIGDPGVPRPSDMVRSFREHTSGAEKGG